MELVVDANILFAGLIKESTTATLLFDTRLKLYCPEFILEEFMKYAKVIQQKLKRKPGEFVTIMHQLNDIIMVIPEEMYEGFIEEARSISPDEEDSRIFRRISYTTIVSIHPSPYRHFFVWSKKDTFLILVGNA